MKKLLFAYLAIFLTQFTFSQTYVWNQCTNFNGGNRFVPFYFTINNKGYVGSGITFSGSTYQYNYTDLWEYDGLLNTWTQMANMPGTCRSAAAGFAVNGKGYVTTGWTPSPVNTTVEYDPVTNTWATKANFMGGNRYSTTYFSIDNYAYVGMGYAPLTNNFWRYDAAADTWAQVASIGGTSRQAAVSFVANNKGYVFGGTTALSSESDELWCYDALNNVWTQKTSLPTSPRYGSMAFSFNNIGFVGCGAAANNLYNDFYTYDPVNDVWAQITSLPATARYGGFGFAINGKGYVGVGASSIVPTSNLNQDLWELSLSTATNNLQEKSFRIYPNPCTGKFYIENNTDLFIRSIRIINQKGQEAFEEKNSDILKIKKCEITLPKIATGKYRVLIFTSKGVISKSLLILK